MELAGRAALEGIESRAGRMISAQMSLTVRERRSAFWTNGDAHHPHGEMICDHRLTPLEYGKAEDKYRHLKFSVQLWDVGFERQIKIVDLDTAHLVQMPTPRNKARMQDD